MALLYSLPRVSEEKTSPYHRELKSYSETYTLWKHNMCLLAVRFYSDRYNFNISCINNTTTNMYIT